MPASILSPSQKVTLRAAAKAIQRTVGDDQALTQIESWNLCKTVGQSRDTFLDNLKYLSENVGVLRKKTERIATEDGGYTTNLYIGANNLIARPDTIMWRNRAIMVASACFAHIVIATDYRRK